MKLKFLNLTDLIRNPEGPTSHPTCVATGSISIRYEGESLLTDWGCAKDLPKAVCEGGFPEGLPVIAA